MRTPLLLAAVGLFVGAAWQATLPSALAGHFDRLTEAKSLTAEYTSRVIGGTPTTYRLSLAKPNRFRLTYPEGFVVSDGKTITTYIAKDKIFSEAPATPEAVATFARRPEVRPWAGFLLKDARTEVVTAKAGAARRVQNNDVTEVTLSLKESVEGTVFVDRKLGIARGASLKSGDKEYLTLATKITLDDAPETEFAFVAPEGARKLEAPQAQATYAMVQEIMNASCMPCHSAQNQRAGIDLTNHAGILAAVTPGDGANSRLVRSLRATGRARMPKNRPALPDAQIQLIEAWVNAGARP